MITLAVTVNGTTRVFPITTTMTRVNRGSWDDWQDEQGPWMSEDDSAACQLFAGVDAEHVNYIYHDGSMTACQVLNTDNLSYSNGNRWELRIDGKHDHDAIVNFFKGEFGASVSE
jgi:hypothetical protein